MTCPTLVLDGERDHFQARDQAQRVFQALAGKKRFHAFWEAEGASLHCQIGAMLLQHQLVFDWLDGVLRSA